MASSCSCCIFNNSATINLSDPCVCNAPIGATLVTNTGQIYVRTLLSSPCNINDWTISGTSSFKVADGFANTQTIVNNDTISFLGQNGIDVKVSSLDTVTINGLTTFGTGAPSFTPTISSQVNLYLDSATGNFYIWSPLGPSWVGPLQTSSGSLAISQICSTVEGSFLNSVPMKVFQDQSGNCKVVQHNHQPYSNPKTRFIGGLVVGLDGGDSSAGQNGDALTYSWSATGGTFDNNTSSTPTLTFTTPGDYRIFLTVTNALGYSHTSQLRISVDRILHVMGDVINQNLNFSTLQAAFNWITANDSGNENLWTIIVHDTTLDAARITPNQAIVHFEEMGQITVGVDFPANQSFLWSGESHSDSHFNIAYDTDFQMHVGNGASVEFNNLSISIGFNSYIIDTLGFCSISFKNCLLVGTRGILMNNAVGGFLSIQNSEIRTSDIILELLNTEINIIGLTADSSGNVINDAIQLDTCYGYFTNSKVTCTKSVAISAILLDIIPNSTKELLIANSSFRIIGTAGGDNKASFIHGAGALVRISNCEFIGQHYGMAVLNNVTVANIYVTNCLIEGNTNSLISSSTYPAITSVALANLNFVNNSFRIAVSGATFVIATNLTNGNFQF